MVYNPLAMKKRILIITCEMLPLPGMPVRGGGLRVWGLGQGLKASGHEVLYSIPKEAVAQNVDLPASYKKLLHEPETINEIVLEVMPDVVIVEQWGLASYLDDLKIPLVIDLHGPLSLENAFKKGSNFLSDAITKIDTLAKADLLVCPGEYQKQYFLSWFLLAGAEPQDAPIEVVPVAFDKKLPKHEWPNSLKFVYGGATWPWIDPFPGLEELARKVAVDEKASLDLYVGSPPINYDHPLYAINKDVFKDYRKRLEGYQSVAIHDFVPRDELINIYRQSSVAFDLYQKNTERQLAFTTRTVEYLWCGLPVIYGDYGELADDIQQYDAGWTINPNDQKALFAVLDEIFSRPEIVHQKGENAQKLARERYTWDQAVKPLARFVSDPKSRKKEGSLIAGMRDYFRRESGNQITELYEELRHNTTLSERERRERDKEINELSERVKNQIFEHDKDLKAQSERHREDLNRKEDDVRRLQEKLDHELQVRDEEIKRLHVDRQLAEQKAQAEIKQLTEEKEKLRDKSGEEQKELTEKKDEEIKQLRLEKEVERNKLQARIDELVEETEEEKAKASEEIKVLNREKEDSRKLHESEVKKLVERNEQEIDKLKREKEEEAKEAQRKFTREVERHEDSDRELNGEVKRLNQKIKDLIEQHSKALEETAAKQETTIREARERADEELKKKDEEVARLRRENERREDQELELTKENKRLNQKMENIKEEHGKTVDELRSKQEKDLEEIGRRADRQVQIRDDNIIKLTDRLDKTREESDKRIKELESEKNKLVETNQLTIARQRDEITELSSKFSRISTQIEERDRQIKRFNEELGVAQEKNEGLEKELKVKLADNGKLVRELDALNEEVASKLIDLERVMIEKEQFVQDAEKRFAAIEDRSEKQKHQIGILNGTLEQVKEDLGKSERALTDRITEAELLTADLQKVRRFARDLEGEVVSLRKRAALQERLLSEFEGDKRLKSRLRSSKRTQRLLVQMPKLGYLFGVNLLTNAYMDKWQKRSGKKVFPGS